MAWHCAPPCCPIPTALQGRGCVCGDGTLTRSASGDSSAVPHGQRGETGMGQQAGWALLCTSVCPSTHSSIRLSLHPLTHSGLVDPSHGHGAATVVPKVVAVGRRRGLVAEPGERCHLPRVTGAMLPWSLVALVLLSPIKAARWPWVQRAVPALCTSRSTGEEPSSRYRIRPCPNSLHHLHPKMLGASWPLSLLVLLVLAAPVCGQAGRCPRAPANPCAPWCPRASDQRLGDLPSWTSVSQCPGSNHSGGRAERFGGICCPQCPSPRSARDRVAVSGVASSAPKGQWGGVRSVC